MTRIDEWFEDGVVVRSVSWPEKKSGDVVTVERGVEVSRRKVTAEEWAELTL